ncbi:30S ribosomal protein S4e [Candidatus Woesearchaeota archaeon]|nr:30S ribosomal protein S4e [Candidatus Woesearchaeota archaeon]
MKCHLKNYVVPKSWTLEKKKNVFSIRPQPGAHLSNFSVPVAHMLRTLDLAGTVREIKYIMNSKAIIIDGEPVKNYRKPVGFMDCISIPALKRNFRVLLNEKGKLTYLEVPDSEIGKKLSRVEGRRTVKGGKIQLNLSDGRNVLSNVECKVGDSVLIAVPVQNITNVFPLEKGATIMLVNGKHTGMIGIVEDIKDNRLWFKKGKDLFETLKEYAFVIGKDKAMVKVQ